MDLRVLECSNTFSIQTSLLNIGHLLHNMGFVPTEVGTTVISLHQNVKDFDVGNCYL